MSGQGWFRPLWAFLQDPYRNRPIRDEWIAFIMLFIVCLLIVSVFFFIAWFLPHMR